MAIFFYLFSHSYHVSYKSLFTFQQFHRFVIFFFTNQSSLKICHYQSILFQQKYIPFFTLRKMWNVACENSSSGEFFNYFLIFYVCMLLDRYFFSSAVIVKILDVIKERFLGFSYVMRCSIQYHLYNLKNVKNAHGGVLSLVKKSNAPPWVFFTFFKSYKWYQIAQRTTYGNQYYAVTHSSGFLFLLESTDFKNTVCL